ncbi:MAG TPA: hypothetical protein VGD38_12180, partial [Pyrinomonadaceae bacterium]
FFLVRRTVLDRLGVYDVLRDEVMEDVRLAEMIKRSGARSSIHHAPGLLRTRMYSTFAEMWECSSKNWFSGMNFSLPLALSSVASMYLGAVAPPIVALVLAVALAAGASADLWLLFIPAALSWLFQVRVMASVSRRSEVSPLYALTAPLGVAVMYAMLFDSTMRITTGRGVTWKGRRIYERHGVRPPRVHTTLMLAFLFLATTLVGPLVNGQKPTREEALKEAGRMVMEAERKVGEVRKSGDRKLIVEAERGVAEALVKATEVWREAGNNDTRLIAAVEELTRLYSVHGDYDKVVERLNLEANYWLERSNPRQQLQTLFVLGIRQSQMKRDAASIETLQRVIEMSRATGFFSLERNALEQLANVYHKQGRAKDAEEARARAKELWAIKEPAPATKPFKSAPATIPAQWVDLPLAPLAAEYRNVEGVNQAVLVNRTTKGIQTVVIGCVLLEENNKTRVLHALTGTTWSHGSVTPGLYYEPFATLNGPASRWSDDKMSCEGAAKMAVTEVIFDDRSGWKADGTDWVVR